jgi:hypothetical protein
LPVLGVAVDELVILPLQLSVLQQDVFPPWIDPAFQPGIDPAFQPEIDPAFQPGIDSAFRPGIDPAFQPGINSAFRPGIDPAFQPGIDPGIISFVQEDAVVHEVTLVIIPKRSVSTVYNC